LLTVEVNFFDRWNFLELKRELKLSKKVITVFQYPHLIEAIA